MNDPISLFVIAIVGLFITYGIISAAVGGIKKELKKQTHIMGLMAQKSGITAEEVNDVLKKY
jgi:hypothetical protein